MLSGSSINSDLYSEPLSDKKNSPTTSSAAKAEPVLANYRNAYAKKSFFAVWNPTAKFATYDRRTAGMDAEAYEDYMSGNISGGGDCEGDCCCCLGKTIAVPIG